MDKFKTNATNRLFESVRPKSENNRKFASLFETKLDGKTVHVVKEKRGYILVTENDSKIGYETFIDKTFSSLRTAVNATNLLEANKFVIKGDLPAAPSQETLEEPDYDEELSLDDESQTDGGEETTDIPTDLEEYQELTGKLAYILRQENDDYDAVAKYVFNSLFAALDGEKVDGNLINSFIEKLQSKSDSGQEEQVDDTVEPTDEEGIDESVWDDYDDYGLADREVDYEDEMRRKKENERERDRRENNLSDDYDLYEDNRFGLDGNALLLTALSDIDANKIEMALQDSLYSAERYDNTFYFEEEPSLFDGLEMELTKLLSPLDVRYEFESQTKDDDMGEYSDFLSDSYLKEDDDESLTGDIDYSFIVNTDEMASRLEKELNDENSPIYGMGYRHERIMLGRYFRLSFLNPDEIPMFFDYIEDIGIVGESTDLN